MTAEIDARLAIAQLYGAFTLLWSVLLLGERPPRWRWLGVALLVLGAIAISR
jgi:drug/metabolite transporter (DMT)-like permease